MKSKETFILKRQDRYGNVIDVKLYEEPEIKKIYLSERKDMRSKWYRLEINSFIWNWFWTEVCRALDAWYKVRYYYVKWQMNLSRKASNKKYLSKYYYTLVSI